MDTSIRITQYWKRIQDRRWRRGIRRLLAWGLLICLLSACAGPMPTRAAEADTPQEMSESGADTTDLSDNNASQNDIITQNMENGTTAGENSVDPGDTAPVDAPDVTTGDGTGASVSIGETAAGETTGDGAATDMTPEDTSGMDADAGTVSADAMANDGSEEPDTANGAASADAVMGANVMADEESILMAAEEDTNELPYTTWQADYDFDLNTSEMSIILQRYKKRADKDGPEEITVPATAVIKGEVYRTKVSKGLFQDANYVRKITFEDGISVYENSMQNMFRECFNLEEVDLGNLDTTGVTNISVMFMNCVKLRSADLSMFDTSRVERTFEMFQNCHSLESVNVSNWDVSSCTDMWYMFADCVNLKSLDLSGWATKKCYKRVDAMDGMFSVGLEELILGPNTRIYSDSSGLMGTWTDGTTTYSAMELEAKCRYGTPTGTYRRVSLGGGRSGTDAGEQAAVTLPDGYKATTELRNSDKADDVQRNGQVSDPDSDENGRLVKTAEWTDHDAGEAEINLTYAVPQQGGNRAVFACGTCTAHGFGTDMAITQMLELLDQYDYVDVLTTETQYWKYFYEEGNFLETARPVAFTLSASDGRQAVYDRLIERFSQDVSELTNYNIINHGSHATAAMIPGYLEAYLKENTPTAIYVSFDGSRGFCNDSNKYHRASVLWPLYGTVGAVYNAAITNITYDDLRISDELLEILAEYQQDGRYYVCSPDTVRWSVDGYDKPYYYRTGKTSLENYESRLLCYASFALMLPYEFIHNNEEIRNYVNDPRIVRTYESFRTVGQKAICYGASFTSQAVQYVTTPLTITDTMDEDLAFDKDDIRVSLTLNGEEVAELPDMEITVDGQNIRIYLSEVAPGEVVHVQIPVGVRAETGYFRTADYGFRDTNAGPAEVTTAAGKTVTVDSPRLYKGTYMVITEVVHGTITDSVMDLLLGADCEISYAPDEGCHLVSITVDGVDVDIAEFERLYAFRNIDANHVIRVVYEPDAVPETPDEPDEPSHSGHHHSHDDVVQTQIVNTSMQGAIQETMVNPVEEPLTIEEAGEMEADGNTAIIATGDDAHMLLWLVMAGAASLLLLVWRAADVRRRLYR